jgi:hypothetical protein
MRTAVFLFDRRFLEKNSIGRRAPSASGGPVIYDGVFAAGESKGCGVDSIAVVAAVGVGLWFGASGQQRFVAHLSSGSWRVETVRIRLPCP